ncbi:putative reverse transcriptase domain-containing protein [Tanacetum coccineum]
MFRKILEKRVAKAIEKYEKTRTRLNNTGGKSVSQILEELVVPIDAWMNVQGEGWKKESSFTNLHVRADEKKLDDITTFCHTETYHVDPSKVESVKNWKTPESSTEIRSFLDLAVYYRRQDEASQILKEKLCILLLALPDGPDDFVSIVLHQNRFWVRSDCNEARNPTGLLQQPEIPEWKWEKITMNFVTKLPKSSSGHDTIWVVVDRLTKSAHFLPIREDIHDKKIAKNLYHENVSRHVVPWNSLKELRILGNVEDQFPEESIRILSLNLVLYLKWRNLSLEDKALLTGRRL